MPVVAQSPGEEIPAAPDNPFTRGLVLLLTASASAQEMEPRTFSPSPVGTNFVVFAVNHATGSVLVDPSLPVTDIHASNTVNVLGLGQCSICSDARR